MTSDLIIIIIIFWWFNNIMEVGDLNLDISIRNTKRRKLEHIVIFYIFSFGSFTFRPFHFLGPQFYSLKRINGLGYIFELDECRLNLGLKLSIWALFHWSELTEQGSDKAVKEVTQEGTTNNNNNGVRRKRQGNSLFGPTQKTLSPLRSRCLLLSLSPGIIFFFFVNF